MATKKSTQPHRSNKKMSFAVLQNKLLEHDYRFLAIDRRFAAIDQKLLDHDHRFTTIDKKLDSVMNSLDGMTGILLRLDEERIFTNEWIHRIEHDVEILKKRPN